MKHLFKPIIWLSFTLISTNSSAQGFSILIDSFEVQAGQEVCIPVKCKGFTQMTSYQFSLEWNAQILKFKRTQHYGLTGMSALDFNGTFSPNHLLHGWSDSLGGCRDKLDGATLFEVCFTAVGSVNSHTFLIPGGNGFAPGNGGAEAYNCLGQNVWSQAGNDTGFVQIIAFSATSELAKKQEPSFQLYPNPAANEAAQVSFDAERFGIASVTLTDLLGRTVLQQTIEVMPGKNNYEIPANLLTSKGMYQVSLQTEYGISTRMLSVL